MVNKSTSGLIANAIPCIPIFFGIYEIAEKKNIFIGVVAILFGYFFYGLCYLQKRVEINL